MTAIKDLGLAASTAALSNNWSFTVDSNDPDTPSDILWQAEGTIPAASHVLIDLAGTGDDDPKDYWGEDAVFAAVHALVIRNTTDGSDAVLHLGGGSDGNGSQAFGWFFASVTQSLQLAPGAFVLCSNGQPGGWAVLDGQSDLLRLSNTDSENDVSYQIIVVGSAPSS
mgnify:CR=1 FL=1